MRSPNKKPYSEARQRKSGFIRVSAEIQSTVKRTMMVFLALVAACASPPDIPITASVGGRIDTTGLTVERIFDANNALFEDWTLIPIRGEGFWGIHQLPSAQGNVSIRGAPIDSASAIMIASSFDPITCPILEWRWLVEVAQPSADLTRRETDDVAAAIMVLFGDPGTMLDPRPVPTLRYAWTGANHPIGSVIKNPYHPEIVRNIVVQNHMGNIKTWITEQRNLRSDYVAAFGEPPNDFVWAIALFIDNDQTGEEAAAQFAMANVYCEN
jgi:hypothetical protein